MDRKRHHLLPLATRVCYAHLSEMIILEFQKMIILKRKIKISKITYSLQYEKCILVFLLYFLFYSSKKNGQRTLRVLRGTGKA
jgi:hypothetical protein